MAQVKGSGPYPSRGDRARAKRVKKNRSVGAPDNAINMRTTSYPFKVKEVSWQVPTGRSTTRNSRTINPLRLQREGIYKTTKPNVTYGGRFTRGG